MKEQQLSLGNQIVNMINEKYNLQLMTIDAAAMTEDIDRMIDQYIGEFFEKK